MFEDSNSPQSLSEQCFLGNLAPPEQKNTTQSKSINLLLKQKLDKQLQAKLNPPKRRGKKRQPQLADRSRSRDNYLGNRFREQYDNVKMQERRNDNKEVIVLSDSEDNKYADPIQMMMMGRPWEVEGYDRMNWKERRKVDRMMAKGMKYFREGKPNDQLSFKVFNTIESYFK